MAYKYVNDNGLKAYTKKVKGALKDLHTLIAISTMNTTESNAQNVKNIADFVAKAKASGIADVNGMAVTCLLSSGYSGLGYLHFVDGNYTLQGVEIQEELDHSTCFLVWDDGSYKKTNLITGEVISSMLTKGARNPIILSPETTEVDEDTYQKLLSDDVDVVFKAVDGEYCAFTYKEDATDSKRFYFSCFSCEGDHVDSIYIYAYVVNILETTPHTCAVTELYETINFKELIDGITAGKLNKSSLSPVLQEIDLTGTDAERKAKLAKFETDWKILTGADDMTGARFAGKINSSQSNAATVLLQYNSINVGYEGVSISDDIYPKIQTVRADPVQGHLTVTPLFSHLEPVEIFIDNSVESKKKNLDNLNAYKANLEQLGVNTTKGFQVLFAVDMVIGGNLQYTGDSNKYIGVSYNAYTGNLFRSEIDATGKYTDTLLALNEDVKKVNILAQAAKAFGAIELKASDNAANKAALTAYKKILTDAGISITNGYSVPVRITGNAQEYHGMLNIGTGALLSGIVTDVNENHHYPFNVSTTDGAITFDANNYFLEKTSNEVTEMLDAIKYSYTPVPLTATTLSNKAQLEVFLSKVPNAKVMHVTYKDVYAGTLHKINGDWFGLLVKNTNNYEDALQVKLQADGTLIEGTTSLAQVNSKLDNIIG